MQTRSRCCNSAYLLRKDRLVALRIHLLYRKVMESCFVLGKRLFAHRTFDILRQRCGAQRIETGHELIVVIVRQETERTTAAGSIIDHFRYDSRILLEGQFVTDTDLTCRLNQHIPITHFMIQFPQQKNLNQRIGFLFPSP